MKKIRKAVIPAAGLGTRFLPQTKAMPKEMLPIIDKPVIQRIVENVVAAGVEDVIIVTGPQKRAIEDHFDRSYDLEERLIEQGKQAIADKLKEIANMANFIYVRQKGPYGNATPLLNVTHLIQDEPFFFFFADDFFMGEVPEAQQMLEVYQQTEAPVMSLVEVDPQDADKYGMVSIAEERENGVVKVGSILEKPGADNAPSNLASVSGYLLTPDILPFIQQRMLDAKGEHSLPVTLNALCEQREVFGKRIEGKYLDTGSHQGYAEALVEVALANEKLAPGFRDFLQERLKSGQ